MRIAWTGAAVGGIGAGSIALLGGQILERLLDEGVEVDLYYSGKLDVLPQDLVQHPNLRIVHEEQHWSWGRWYSRNRIVALITSFAARAGVQIRLSTRLVREHRRRRYDCVFQFSVAELLLMGFLTRFLPPIVVHPSTTAAGELTWHKRESRYARQHEGAAFHAVVRLYLHLRTWVQRRQFRKVKLIGGASRVFLRTLESDYGVSPSRTRLLRYPVDVDFYAEVTRPPSDREEVTLLFPSRLSVRKGLDLVTALTHRIDDLAGALRIIVLGGPSMWSDYSGHLADLNPRTASYVRHVPLARMRELYGRVDAVLAPSHYEPFSLVTAEAVAAGIPVIASDQIGAAEDIDPQVCRIFASGDLDALERAVRQIEQELRRPGRAEELAEIARAEADQHYRPEPIGREYARVLAEAAGISADGGPGRGTDTLEDPLSVS